MTPALDRFVAFDHCRHELPLFSWHRSNESSAQLHRLALELSRPGTQAEGRTTRTRALACYLLSGLRQSIRSLRLNARQTRRIHGVPVHRQLTGVLRTVFRRNASPDIYYIHRLFRPSDPQRIGLFFEHRELMLLLRALYASLETDRIAHKIRFHDFCQNHALPTPPLWAVFQEGKILPERSARWLARPGADIFVKPADDYAGHGVVRWRHDPELGTYSNGTRSLTHEKLTEELAQDSTDGIERLVQPRITESAELAPLAGDAVCNFRILTGCPPGGTPQVLTTAVRLPAPGHYLTDVDNDIFAAPVDIVSGRLAAAQAKAIAQGIHIRHPVSGAQIEGRTIGNWPEIATLATRAHAACSWLPFVGWDIVNAVDGPVLLEGNAYWGGNLCQMSGHRFLGETAFPAIYLAHLSLLRPDLARFLQR